MMNYKALYEELLKSHEALQLRVTQFSKVEQDLIKTRDQLDQEALMHKRVSQFSLKAMGQNEPQELLNLTAESMLDTFEVEASVAFYICPEGNKMLAAEGMSLNESLAWNLFNAVRSGSNHKHEEAYILFPFDLEDPTTGEFIHQAFVYHKKDPSQKRELLLVALNTEAKKQWYQVLDPRHTPIFTVLGQKAEALLVKSEINKALARQNDQLSKANRELDQFVYSVSHDLRSPLLAIKGLLDLLQTEQSAEVKAKYFELATDSINRLDNSIEEILNYSRNARVAITHSSFDLIGLIKEIIESNRHSTAHPVEVNYETPADIMISTDQTRVTVILRNLISNAFKYGANVQGKIKLRIRSEQRNDGIRLLIRDYGRGIPEEIMPKIFDMFYRGTKASRGSGLGLYIVKETVEKLNGTIKARSKASGGTEFELFIPLNETR